jgi:hypothetical protein
MAYPSVASVRTVTAKYLNASGAPATGRVLFRPSAVVEVSTGEIIMPKSYEVTLSTSGNISVSLPCTDDVDLTPSGWLWICEERIEGGRKFAFSLPAGPGQVTLNALSTYAPTGGEWAQYVRKSAVGVAFGVAPLDASGRVPLDNLPIDTTALFAGEPLFISKNIPTTTARKFLWIRDNGDGTADLFVAGLENAVVTPPEPGYTIFPSTNTYPATTLFPSASTTGVDASGLFPTPALYPGSTVYPGA